MVIDVVQPWLDRATRDVETCCPPPAPDADPQENRARARRANATLWARAGHPDDDLAVDTSEVWTDGPHRVRLVVHRPRVASGATPAVMTFFGGAFRQGGVDYATVWATDRWRAQSARVTVVAVDYDLAPEHPWPMALNQGLAALGWLAANAEAVGVDARRLAVSGISAGANLAAATALANRDRPQVPLRLLLLEVPPLDLTWEHLDYSTLHEEQVPAGLVDAVDTYLAGTGACARDPLVSPLLAPDLGGLPDTYVLAAESDPLVGDARAFARRLDEADVPVSLMVAAGQSHDSNTYVGVSLAARQWQRCAVAALVTLHQQEAW